METHDAGHITRQERRIVRLKLITETMLRDELKGHFPEAYHVPDDVLMTPAALEYLSFNKVKVLRAATGRKPSAAARPSAPAAATSTRYVDAITGATYDEKPENMTHLVNNRLVLKTNARIVLRGRLDDLQSQVVLTQAEILDSSGRQWLADDLQSTLALLRELMRCEVLDETYVPRDIIGLAPAELRAQSHDPLTFFGVKAFTLPEAHHDRDFLRLNVLRTQARMAEIAAVEAFTTSEGLAQPEMVQALNRLSSAYHILMCRVLSGYYESR